MKCPDLHELPPPPPGKTGWPWTAAGGRETTDYGLRTTDYGLQTTDYGLPSLSSNQAPSTKHQAPSSPLPSTFHLPPTTSHLSLPRISLVMPCLNAAAYIEEALRSVLLQGYPDLELMVIDGGSTDGTVEIIRRYEPWLAYWASEKDRGQSHAINKGLARATGELFNWVNADDVVCPDGLNTLVELYVRQSHCAGVFGAMEVFDANGYCGVWLPVPGTKEDIGLWGKEAFLPQPSALFSRELCQSVGGVNEKLHYVMDIDLIMRLSDHGGFAVTQRPTYRYRRHEGAKTVKGDIAGMVELLAAEFNMGMPKTAERWLQWRMEGAAQKAIGELTDRDVAKLVDGWPYVKVARYLGKRLWKNISLRLSRMVPK